MSRLDVLKDPIARAIDRAVEALEEQLDGQLEDGRRRLREAGAALKSELPDTLLSDDAVAGLAAGAEGVAADGLLEAVARIDAASSQAAVLSALLEGAQAVADRSAFFVASEAGLDGWKCAGFDSDADVGGRRVAFEGPWERLPASTGAARLDGEDAAAFSSALDAGPASAGVFVPLFLRNRLGGFLYADKTNGHAPLDTAALRLLTHVAALSLETLGVRAGASATLAVDDGSASTPQPLFLSASPAAVAAPATPEPLGDDTVAGLVAEDVQSTEDDDAVALSQDEASGLEEAAAEAASVVDDDLTTSVKPPQDPATEELFGEETITEHLHVDASFPTISKDVERPSGDEKRDTDTLELEPIDPSLIERPADMEDVPTGGVSFELDDDRFARQPSPQRTVRLDVEDPSSPAPSASASEPADAAPAADSVASEDATVMAQRSTVYQPPSEDAPAADEKPRKTTEVQPPTDLSGPGSAFLAGDSAGDDALRDEARRLARLLVSEIRLYNEDSLEEGRREGNIYNRLKEDIDRSRKMYHERIDPRLEDADDFFHQELVDRLAGGNADLLGM